MLHEGLPTGWGGRLPASGQGSKVYVLCAEPKEHKRFRPGTRPGGIGFPAGRIGNRGDRGRIYFLCLGRLHISTNPAITHKNSRGFNFQLHTSVTQKNCKELFPKHLCNHFGPLSECLAAKTDSSLSLDNL